MQLSDTIGACTGAGPPTGDGTEPCRFPKLEECAHFHYERVQLPKLDVKLEGDMDKSLHSQHTLSSLDGTPSSDPSDYYTLQVTCRDECWLIQRSMDNFAMLDAQLHQCIYDRKVSQLEDLSELQKRKERNKSENDKDGEEDVEDEDGKADLESILTTYLDRLCSIIDNSLNCGPILNWFQLDNRGHRLLVPSEESRSINTPAVAAAYSVRKYVSQARDELSLEVGDMISVIDMASPGESVWWRGKRGFQVGFFPQHCVHIIGDKVPRNMPLPPPVVGSLAISPIKPVLRKHGKLITFFRSFILNRPSRRRLKQTGILKERVFGCDLGEHLLNSGHDIPMVLKCCAEFIESHGIVDGIYRLSGVTSNIQKLRNAFDEDRIPNLYTDDILQDIHSVASLLKMYFRELPNPLCTYQLYHSFVSAVQGCSASRNKANDNERLLKMREAVQKLPPPHYRTLEYLMRHLSRIAAHGARTGMTTRNVAIVWAPNLLRCEELEIGGVAALQGVGVQAVVTEFLVCYADLIFSERVPPMLEEGLTRLSNVEREVQVSPKRSRPKSLAISTPTKLLTLEEARNKHLLNKSDDGNYIEVGGGPKSLPKKYHTVIELPAGSRKRGLNKRSPSGWRSFFSKSRNSSHGNLSKREISSPGIIAIDKSVTESDLNDIKRKLRPVKSAESLTSGQSEPATCDADVLGPLHCLQKPSGHNRSVSHDSYFDNLQSSQNNSVGSLLDLSEIQLNFELEESEMRIFSEDESLVSSPKVQKESTTRKTFSRSRFDDNYSSCTNSSNPSPKKQPRVVLSPDSMSRKRSRLEDQLSDIQYIDCNTPENPCVISTTAQIHTHDDQPGNGEKIMEYEVFEGYQPKNKSPRNSSDASNRYSLNFEKIDSLSSKLPKSLTETDFKTQHSKSHSFNLTPTPQTPNYKPLDSTSTTNTPILSPSSENINNRYSNNFESLSPMDSRANFISSTSEERDLSSLNDDTYQNVYQNVPTNKRYSNNFDCIQLETKTNEIYENVAAGNSPGSPTYENILTTISIVYKSPVKSRNNSENIYEDIELTPEQAEKAVIPTTAASLPSQEASQPAVENITNKNESLPISINQESIENIETPSLSSLPSTPTNISAKVSLETTFDSSIITICSDSICVENTTLKQEDDSSDSSEQQNRPSDLQLFDKSKDDKSIDFNSTYRSIDSLSSASENTPDNISKKSLITPTEEVSFSEVEPKTSDTSSTATSPKLSTSSPEQSPILSPNVTNCTTQLSQLDITCADDSSLSQNINDNACGTFNVVKKRFGSTDTISSLINNQNKLITADKRKSCDAEILDDGTIYQQVKYFRRSIHEINSLIDDKPPEKNLIKPKSIHNSLNNLSETVNIDNITLDNLEFDSLETENIHLYENIEITKNNDNSRTVLDTSRIRMHENEPKKIDITPEVVQELPVCSKCCDTTDPVKGINVKNLTSKFEPTKTDNNQTIQTPNQKIIKHNYDKDNLPPCLRAKNAKNSIKTRSLDENAFVTEFGRTNSNLQRRKSLDDRTSSYIDSKLLVDCVSKLSSVSTSDIRHDTKNTNRPSVESLYNTLGSEQKLNRERIEKYKEERRNFWREKYRSESFKEDKDKILSRLKQKSFKSTKSELDTLEYKNNDYKKLPQDTISKFENKPDGAINKTSSFRVKNTSPLFERKKKSSLKELSDKLLDESTDETCLLRVSKEDEFLRHRRSDGESERRRHTYDLLREREVDDRDRRVSLESKNPRKEKCSPSYCIKDMKAIFESKSQQ